MSQTVCPLVSTEDRNRLEAIIVDRNRPQKHVARARIILHSSARLNVGHVSVERSLPRRASSLGKTPMLRLKDAYIRGCSLPSGFGEQVKPFRRQSKTSCARTRSPSKHSTATGLPLKPGAIPCSRVKPPSTIECDRLSSSTGDHLGTVGFSISRDRSRKRA